MTQIRATDAAGAEKLISTLGTGDALLAKINTEFKKQGLEEATGTSAPTKATLSGTAMALLPAWTLVLVMQVYAIAVWFRH